MCKLQYVSWGTEAAQVASLSLAWIPFKEFSMGDQCDLSQKQICLWPFSDKSSNVFSLASGENPSSRRAFWLLSPCHPASSSMSSAGKWTDQLNHSSPRCLCTFFCLLLRAPYHPEPEHRLNWGDLPTSSYIPGSCYERAPPFALWLLFACLPTRCCIPWMNRLYLLSLCPQRYHCASPTSVTIKITNIYWVLTQNHRSEGR